MTAIRCEQLITLAGSGIGSDRVIDSATSLDLCTYECEERHKWPIIAVDARLNNSQVLMGIGFVEEQEKKYQKRRSSSPALTHKSQGISRIHRGPSGAKPAPNRTKNGLSRILPHQSHARDRAGEAEADVVDGIATGGVGHRFNADVARKDAQAFEIVQGELHLAVGV